jgi:hypothetical protein
MVYEESTSLMSNGFNFTLLINCHNIIWLNDLEWKLERRGAISTLFGTLQLQTSYNFGCKDVHDGKKAMIWKGMAMACFKGYSPRDNDEM